ncbi:MAG: SPASM domain-containing protein [Planctomycetota bacterium]
MSVRCEPAPGETRDCLDPWKMAYVKADGAVTLCCWSQPVGNVKHNTIQEILHDEPARALRRGLLTGQMPDDCIRCPARGLVSTEALRQKVDEYVSDDDRREMMAVRARLHGLQEEVVQLRHHASNLEADRDNWRTHARNLEEERAHLRGVITGLTTQAEALSEQVAAVEQGRVPLGGLIRTWLRGRVRRSKLGGRWFRPPTGPR